MYMFFSFLALTVVFIMALTVIFAGDGTAPVNEEALKKLAEELPEDAVIIISVGRKNHERKGNA